MTADSIETREEHACFGGRTGFYRHASRETGTTMGFAVYLPPQAERGPVPALYYLAGLTCTEETFVIKAGAQRLAAEHGLALVACDTSPRGRLLLGQAPSDPPRSDGCGKISQEFRSCSQHWSYMADYRSFSR